MSIGDIYNYNTNTQSSPVQTEQVRSGSMV
jgi:hypothetical protein